MINWRKPVIEAALRVTRSDVPSNRRTIRRLWNASPEAVDRYQRDRLKSLLAHAHATVPYYAEVLEETGVVTDGTVHLERYEALPLLTKETIRESGDRLVSTEPGTDPYTNTSGGTTGEPVRIVQDDEYWAWNVANKLFYQELAGKPLGGREVKLWGSERDVLEGRESLAARAINVLYNRTLLNSFRMGPEEMRAYVETINDVRPHTIWAYVESIHQLATFVERTGLDVYSPNGIVTTAGTLHEPVRETIETVFDTTVYNQYGSREVGDMACECSAQDGLHVFSHTHYIEIVDDDGYPVPPGKSGHIVVTNLVNRSMPLLRYRIGDVGVAASGRCDCGRPFLRLESVTGRVTDHFVSVEDELVHGEYFTHLLFEKPWVRKFQVRQETRESVVIRIVPNGTDAVPSEEFDELVEGVHAVMGESVDVEVDLVESIPAQHSGKFRYTISDVTPFP